MCNLKALKDRPIFIIGVFVLLVSIIRCLFITNNFPSENHKTIEGKVESYISYVDNKQKFIISNNKDKLKYLISTSRDYKVAKGEHIKCIGNFVPSNNVYFKSKNLVGTVYNCNNLELISRASAFDMFLNNIRNYIEDFTHRNLKEPDASLVSGMLIGNTENFGDEFRDSLIISGTMHIIAVSGFNVNFIILVFFSTSFLILNRFKSVFILEPILLLYLLIVGIDNIPALRATIMASYYLFAEVIGKKADFLNTLGLSIVIILFINNGASVSVSFYYSFFSIIGQYFLNRKLKQFIKSDVVAVSLSCMIASLPITLFVFRSLHIWSLLINILIAPLLPIILVVALVAIVFNLLFLYCPEFILFTLQSLVRVLVDLISIVDILPVNNIRNLSFLHIILILIVFILFFYLIKEICLKINEYNKDINDNSSVYSV